MALADAQVSPIYADYDATFPPSMITTGTRDLFLSDCIRLYWKLHQHGVVTHLRVWEGRWHAFLVEPSMEEAIECRTELARFLCAALEPVTEEGAK